MKVLISCFSQTGNTQQLADAIHEVVSAAHDVEMRKVEDTTADRFAASDLVFVGSPIHAGGLAEPVRELLESLPENPCFKLAAFITHASFAYESAGFDKGMQSLDDITKSKGITYLGSYDCQGKLSDELKPMVKQSQDVSDEEWDKRMAEVDQHPNDDDIQKAKDFAKDILAKCQPSK